MTLLQHIKEINAFFARKPDGVANIKLKDGTIKSYTKAGWQAYLQNALLGRTSRGNTAKGKRTSEDAQRDLRRFQQRGRQFTVIRDVPHPNDTTFLKILKASWPRTYRNHQDEYGFQSFEEAKAYAKKIGLLKPTKRKP